MLEEIKKLPKIELHVHLDGSVNLGLIKELLDNVYSKTELRKLLQVGPCDMNLNDYLKKFAVPLQLLQTKENIKLVARKLITMLKADNVIYAEVRFAPQLHTKEGLSYDEIISSVIEGLKDNRVKTNVILCCMRGVDTTESNYQTIAYAKKYLNKGVCAIDLAGAEGLYATKDYEYIFTKCQELGIPYTIHAGEDRGKESIEAALAFKTKRLGHGIVYEDNIILERYLKEDITLEVCPTSNLQTKVIASIKEHPIYDLYKKGVLVTINTDNRTVSNTTLNAEYMLLMNNFAFTINDFKQLNINALKAAFLSTEEKLELMNKLRVV